mmetsp:Transcript_16735/g.31543  ORF Transcript_16735/g.31543 Transcript_16735/m.31543 type:complete len:204 (+) Transcript_16735:827-1438(+)
MGGRLAAAQHVVIHARHVVMHQRVGVDQLDGACRPHRRKHVAAHRLTARQHKQRSQPLAAAQHRVAHRLAQASRRLHRHQAVQCRLDSGQGRVNPAVKVLCIHCSGALPGLQFTVIEQLDLLLDRLQPAAAQSQQLRASLVGAQQLIQRQLLPFHRRHQALQLIERLLVAERIAVCRSGLGAGGGLGHFNTRNGNCSQPAHLR